jgi:hypothetical protein
MYNPLPAADQKLQVWAQSLTNTDFAEASQREFSDEYFKKWLAEPQSGALGSLPLIVLARAEGGYGDDLDVPATELEAERKAGQAMLARLSKKGRLVMVRSGHNMELEAPDDVVGAIREVVEAVRRTPTRAGTTTKGGPPSPI